MATTSDKMKFVIVADGEGAQACVIANKEIHQAVHDFMCCCDKDWKNCACGRSMIQDIEMIDDKDYWTIDENCEYFSISWPHETGKITIYRLSEVNG